MPLPVGRVLTSVLRVIRSLHNLPDHIVHLDRLTGRGAAPPSAVFHLQNRLLKFAELAVQPIGDQPPLGNVLGEKAQNLE